MAESSISFMTFSSSCERIEIFYIFSLCRAWNGAIHDTSTFEYPLYVFPLIIQRTATNKFWHRRKHSVDIDADKLQHEFNSNFTPFVEESNALSDPGTASIPSDSLQTYDALHNQHNDIEEQAAIRIQTMFRGFLVLLVLIYSCFSPIFRVTFLQFILCKVS